MIDYIILQAPPNLFSRIGFITKNTEVDMDDYCSVYKGQTQIMFENYPSETLDKLFDIFQSHFGFPKNYAGRSLSIGDIIKLDKNYWLLTYDGWIKIREEGKE